MQVFYELSAVLVVATVLALIARMLRQPLVIAYIATGILLGPGVLNVLQSSHELEVMAKLGITILLFIVGLSLNPSVIRDLGRVSIITGVGQVLATSAVGFVIALMLGLDRVAALYVSVALTFSSTIIILKLLTDKGDLHKLYGKISIGLLLVQDLIATLILILFSSFGTATGNPVETAGIIVVKGGALAVFTSFMSFAVIPHIARSLAASQELLFIASLAWGLGMASLFAWIGFSVEIGALVAGVTLASGPYATEVSARLKPLRDFFIVMFFILLGSQMTLSAVSATLVPALILSIFVLIGNPAIMIVIMNLLGYKRKTGFMAGITVAQISEFSLILATLGFQLGHISAEILSMITLVGIITIAGSSYLILYSERMYKVLERILVLLELKKSSKEQPLPQNETYDLVLIGYDKVGKEYLSSFKSIGGTYIVIDYNPSILAEMDKAGVPYQYGDIEDPEFLEEMRVQSSRLIVSTVPYHATNAHLLRYLKKERSRAISIVVAQSRTQALDLYALGASYVIVPHYLGGKHASNLIKKYALDRGGFSELRDKHIEDLKDAGH